LTGAPVSDPAQGCPDAAVNHGWIRMRMHESGMVASLKLVLAHAGPINGNRLFETAEVNPGEEFRRITFAAAPSSGRQLVRPAFCIETFRNLP
jgi:hypothetical protein